MYRMFKQLFIDTDADDLAAKQDQRRRVRRSQRARPALIVRPAARNRDNRRGCDRRRSARRWIQQEPDGVRCLLLPRSPGPRRL